MANGGMLSSPTRNATYVEPHTSQTTRSAAYAPVLALKPRGASTVRGPVAAPPAAAGRGASRAGAASHS